MVTCNRNMQQTLYYSIYCCVLTERSFWLYYNTTGQLLTNHVLLLFSRFSTHIWNRSSVFKASKLRHVTILHNKNKQNLCVCLRYPWVHLQNCEKRLSTSFLSPCIEKFRSHWTDLYEIRIPQPVPPPKFGMFVSQNKFRNVLQSYHSCSEGRRSVSSNYSIFRIFFLPFLVRGLQGHSKTVTTSLDAAYV